jgi:hypothetical protein
VTTRDPVPAVPSFHLGRPHGAARPAWTGVAAFVQTSCPSESCASGHSPDNGSRERPARPETTAGSCSHSADSAIRSDADGVPTSAGTPPRPSGW